MFTSVSKYLRKSGHLPTARRTLQIKPDTKDVSTAFDLFGEQRIVDYCEAKKLNVVVVAEETGQ